MVHDEIRRYDSLRN